MNNLLRFEPNHGITQVVVVGLGGTGSQVARSLARTIFDMRRRDLATPKVLFVDPDTVEERNVGRQMFTWADAQAHVPKAEILARRFNWALGLDIEWAVEPFDPQKHASMFGTLLIGCVDNFKARRALAESNSLWLDAGNAFTSGQVICGSTADADEVKHALNRAADNDGTLSVLPNAALVFPELLEPEPETTPTPAESCAELVESGEQHLLVNDAMAMVTASYIYRLLHRQPLTSHMTYIDAETMVSRPIAISRENLEVYL